MIVHVREDVAESSHPADMYFNLLRGTILNVFYANLIQRCIVHGEDTWAGRFHYSGTGIDALNNIRFCCEDVIKNKIPGDFLHGCSCKILEGRSYNLGSRQFSRNAKAKS